MPKLPLLLSLCIIMGGCAMSDGTENEPAASETPRKTTLERAQTSVRKRIDRMRYQSGEELLRTIQELVAMKTLALEPILEALPGADERTRANLIYVLGYLGGADAHKAVVASLGAKSDVVRYEAAAALITLGDWSGVPVLITYLDSPDKRLRYKAWQTLQQATSKDFGYDFNATQATRAGAVASWRKWWEQQRETILYGRG